MTDLSLATQQAVQASAIVPQDDYFGLTDASNLQAIQTIKANVQRYQRQTLENVMVIGNELNIAKSILGDRLLDWADIELGISKSTAHNFMATANKYMDSPKIPSLGKLPLDAVYALASHTVPELAEDEVLQRVESGERVTVQVVREITAKHKDVAKPAPKVPPKQKQTAQSQESSQPQQPSSQAPATQPVETSHEVSNSMAEVSPAPQAPSLVRAMAASLPRFKELVSMAGEVVAYVEPQELLEGFQQMAVQDRKEAISCLEVLLDKAREAHGMLTSDTAQLTR